MGLPPTLICQLQFLPGQALHLLMLSVPFHKLEQFEHSPFAVNSNLYLVIGQAFLQVHTEATATLTMDSIEEQKENQEGIFDIPRMPFMGVLIS